VCGEKREQKTIETKEMAKKWKRNGKEMET